MVKVILVIGFSILSYVVGHDVGWEHGYFKGWMKGLDDGLGLEDVLDLTGHN
jgi:hypothetical protein